MALVLLSKLRRLQRLLNLEVCRVVTRPLCGDPRPQGTADEILVRLMTQAALLPHCADPELELPEPQVRAAFGRGDLCVGALHGAKLVGYQWLAFGPTPHVDGIWVEFDPRSRYSYKKFVRPQYRGRRIAARLSRHADALCRHRGRGATVSFIDLHNRASWRSSARLGSRTAGYAGYLRFGDVFIALRSPGAKRCAFRFYRPAGAAEGSTLALGVAGKKSLDRRGG